MSSVVGSYAYTNCSDGSSATSSTIGSYTYTNSASGASSTRTQIGNIGYTNYSDGSSATSQQIGQVGYTNYSDGTSATTQRIGPNTYTNYSDGSSASTTRIGGTSSQSVSSSPSTIAAPASSAAPAVAPPAPYGITTYAYGSLVTLPPGLMVKGSGPAIYVIFDGQRLPFATWPQYLAWGGASDLSNVAVMLDSDLAAIPVGPVMPTRA